MNALGEKPGSHRRLSPASWRMKPQSGEQLVLVDAGRAQLEAVDHGGEQLAARLAPLGDQQIEVPGVGAGGRCPGAVEVLAQPLDPDPPLDQPQHVAAGVVRFEHDAGRGR